MTLFKYSDLELLLKKQQALDEIILKKSNLDVDDSLLLKQATALNVEVAELANEMKFFKQWQKNPKTSIDKIMLEYADVLHFLLSISLFLEVDFNFYEDYHDSMLAKISTDPYFFSFRF